MASYSIRLLTVIVILFFGALGVSSPLISLYLEALGASFSRISLILASAAGTTMLCNYMWGRLSDRLRQRKALIVGGLLGMALAYELLNQATTPSTAWIAWILDGVSRAAYVTPSLALIGDLLATSDNRGRRMGTYRGLGSLAFAVGAVIGGRIADQYSLELAFRLCALFYFVGALFALALRESSSKSTDAAVDEITTPAAAKRPLPSLFLIGVFLWVTALSSSASMWPNFMSRLGYSKTTISSLWALSAVIEAPAMRVIGGYSDVIGRVPLLAAGGIGIGLVMVGYISLSRFLPALVGIQIGRGLAYASYTTTSMIFATEWGNQYDRGRHSGLFNAATGSGLLAGLFMSGNLVQFVGFDFLFTICGISAFLSAVCFWLLRSFSEPQPIKIVS